MDIPVKALKNGFSLPVYGLGLWQMEADDIERIRSEYPNKLDTSDRVALDYEADVAA